MLTFESSEEAPHARHHVRGPDVLGLRGRRMRKTASNKRPHLAICFLLRGVEAFQKHGHGGAGVQMQVRGLSIAPEASQV